MRRKAVDLLLRKADMRDTGGHKEYKYLYQRMLDEEVIRKAYKKLRKGKTKRNEIIYIDAHLDEEVQKMHDMILNTKPPDVPVGRGKSGADRVPPLHERHPETLSGI